MASKRERYYSQGYQVLAPDLRRCDDDIFPWGGATVMMTSGEPTPDNVVAFVEDCGYTSV